MKNLFSGYDLILVDTSLEKAYNPIKFLDSIHTRLNANGIFIIASNYDWNSERTERDQWLGGFKVNGENTTTLDSLQSILSPHFKQIDKPIDIQQVIRKHRRSFDHNIVQITVWEKQS